MAVLSSPPADIYRTCQRASRKRAFQITGILGVVLVCLWYGDFFELERYSHGVPELWKRFVAEAIPPDFSRYQDWAPKVFDTWAMSIGGTAIAVVFSFPLAFLAARNTAPHPLIYLLTRGLLIQLRAIPELIMGIMFLVAVGLGILPAIWALGLHSVGMVGKFFAEAIERCDPDAVEAVAATGANRVQVLWHGVLPQVRGRMADIAFYRWEYNFRASTVMGMVGCGGIGQEIQTALALMEYRQVSALLLIVAVCVTAVEALSNTMRRHSR
jgi:phosphonate transport system permease protein